MHKWGIVLIFFVASYPLWNCANQTTPMGGPKDTIPPIIVKSIPANKQRNYKDKEIQLVFNEAVNLNNAKEEILISPTIGKDVEYKVRKNTVTINPAKPWEDNTTYSITFREGVRDITENNAPKNLKLAFSTGPLIDSMSVKGRVKNALNTTLPEKITVALFQSDTFNIFKHSPQYFTQINDRAEFSLENIKAGIYYIYAFEDKNKNLKVESRTEKFGFLSNPIELLAPIGNIEINLVNLDMRELKMNNSRNNGLQTRIKFNKSISTYTLRSENNNQLIHSFGDDQSEVVMYNPTIIKDSLRLYLFAQDSISTIVDTTIYIKQVKENLIRGDFTAKAGGIKYNSKIKTLTQNLVLSKPIKYLNYDSISIKIDSAHTIPVTAKDFHYDSANRKLTLTKEIPPDTLFPKQQIEVKVQPQIRRTPTVQPELVFSKSSIISVEADTLKMVKYIIDEPKKEQLGTLLIETKTEAPNFIIQLITPNGTLVEEVKSVTKYTFENLPAANYKLRVIIDRNNNGQWDPGNYYNKEEPEPTWYYQTQDKKFEFPIRANWELGPIMLIF